MRLLLIPLLPFLGFLVNATVGRRWPKNITGGIATADIPAAAAGIHGLSIAVASTSADGAAIDRGAFLTFEVQPSAAAVAQAQASLNTTLLAGVAALVLAALGVIGLVLRRRARR
mgnify:CR=1 FL=1